MNQTIDTILTRRSVRSYSPRPIPRDLLEMILKAGDAGPSGANNRMWRYVVVQDPALRAKLTERSMVPYKRWLENMPEQFRQMRAEVDKLPDPIYYGAPVIVFVIGRGLTSDVDCPIACQNMMLAARSLDIGSCWVYIGQLVTRDPEVRTELGLSQGEKVYGPVILGYPGEGFPPSRELAPLPVKWI